jgi:hypothetical protein
MSEGRRVARLQGPTSPPNSRFPPGTWHEPADSTSETTGAAPTPRRFVVLILVGLVCDLQDLDEAEGGAQASQGCLLVGVELGPGRNGLAPRWLVASGPEVEVDPAALELELVDLALAVVLAAGFEGEDLQVAGEVLELGQ